MEIPTRFHFCHRVEVAFADTDLAGIVHFANFLRYAENTEHAFLRSIGLSVHTTEGARQQGWPRLHVACDFHRPARFGETLCVALRVQEIRTHSLTYGFWIFGPSSGPTAPVASGRCAIVHVSLDTATREIRKAPVPTALRAALEREPTVELPGA
jgi:YbgC/YbaW family acyl-CoA thioester hydrolase